MSSGITKVKDMIIDTDSLKTIWKIISNVEGSEEDIFEEDSKVIRKEVRSKLSLIQAEQQTILESQLIIQKGKQAVKHLITDVQSDQAIANILIKLRDMAGEKALELFEYGLPAVRQMITDKESLESIGIDLIKLNMIKGFNRPHLYRYMMPKLNSAFTKDELSQFWPGIVKLSTFMRGVNIGVVSQDLLNLNTRFSKEELKQYWPDFVELGIASGRNSSLLFSTALPKLKDIFTKEEFKQYWPDVMQLGMRANINAPYIFLNGFPEMKHLITNIDTLKSVGNILVKLCEASANEVSDLFNKGLPEMKYLINNSHSLETIGSTLIKSINTLQGLQSNIFFHFFLPFAKQFIVDRESLESICSEYNKLQFAQDERLFEIEFDVLLPALKSIATDGREFVSMVNDVFKYNNEFDAALISKLLELFTKDEIRAYWPDLLTLASKAGKYASKLFQEWMPAVKYLITDRISLVLIGNGTIDIAIASGKNVSDFFQHALPKLDEIFTTKGELIQCWPDLVKIGVAKGPESANFFLHVFPVIYEAFEKWEMKESIPDLLKLGIVVGDKVDQLFATQLPKLNDVLMKEEIQECLPDILKIGILSGKSSLDLFEYVVPKLKQMNAINDKIMYYEFSSKIKSICNNLNDYNKDYVLGNIYSKACSLFSGDNNDYLLYIDLAEQVASKKPRLCYQILNNILQGISNNLITLDTLVNNKEKMFQFIDLTNSFSPTLFDVYAKGGVDSLNAVLLFAKKILDDNIGHDEVADLISEYESQGMKGIEILLAAIQVAIPSSGASFVNNNQLKGLLSEYIDQGDKRSDVPYWLRNRDFSDGTVINLTDNRLKDGEKFDPEHEVEYLYTAMKAKMEIAPENEKELIKEKDKKDFKVELSKYFANMTEENKEHVLNAFLRYSSHYDQLGEKIDRIKISEYTGISLLEELFIDKDNLSVLFKDVLNEMGPDVLPNVGYDEHQPAIGKGLIKSLGGVWAQDKTKSSDEDKGKYIENLLKPYSAAKIRDQILPQINDEKLKTVIENIANEKIDARKMLPKEIVEDVFNKPLRIIQHEKSKFEAIADAGKVNLEFRVVKGIPYGLWGMNAGVCIARDVELWNNPNFMLMAMIDKETNTVAGFAHLFVEHINGKTVLTVPGINPSTEFLSTVKEREVFPLIDKALRKIAEEGGYDALYFPTSRGIISNRSGIASQIQKQYSGNVVKLPQEIQWNTLPSPYPFDEVYKVWKR